MGAHDLKMQPGSFGIRTFKQAKQANDVEHHAACAVYVMLAQCTDTNNACRLLQPTKYRLETAEPREGLPAVVNAMAGLAAHRLLNHDLDSARRYDSKTTNLSNTNSNNTTTQSMYNQQSDKLYLLHKHRRI